MIFPASTPLRACFLPLSAVETGHDLGLFLSFLHNEGLNSWAMLPIHEPAFLPYRNAGLGAMSREYLWSDLRENFNLAQLESLRAKLMQTEADWLFEAAFFQALSEYFQTSDWSHWPALLRQREPLTLANYKKLLAEKTQFYLDRELDNLLGLACLRKITHQAHLKLIGDCPFYIGGQTFVSWWQQDLFLYDERHRPLYVSGVPDHPDEPFARQEWGHPLYAWSEKNKSQNEKITAFFCRRLLFLNQFFDVIRLDHANGFFQYGALDQARQNSDQVFFGPGATALNQIVSFANSLELGLFFENVAADQRKLERFMSQHHLLGMEVLTFSFQPKIQIWEEKIADVTNLSQNNVYYSSTHDTETLLGWLKTLSSAQLKQLLRLNHLPVSNEASPEYLALKLRIMLLQNKKPPLIIIPLQDFLLQTSRLNIPGTPDEENWHYVLSAQPGFSS